MKSNIKQSIYDLPVSNKIIKTIGMALTKENSRRIRNKLCKCVACRGMSSNASYTFVSRDVSFNTMSWPKFNYGHIH